MAHLDTLRPPSSEAATAFLARALEEAARIDHLTPETWIVQFTLNGILERFEDPRLEAFKVRLLLAAQAGHEQVLAKKTLGSAKEDVRLAMEEGLLDAHDVFTLFSWPEWITILGTTEPWHLLRQRFSEQLDAETTREWLTSIVTIALDEHALSADVTVQDLAPSIHALPPALILRIAQAALEEPRADGIGFRRAELLDVIPLRELTQSFAMTVWEPVLDRIGLAYKFTTNELDEGWGSPDDVEHPTMPPPDNDPTEPPSGPTISMGPEEAPLESLDEVATQL